MNKAELRSAVIERNSVLGNETKRLSDEAIAKKLIELLAEFAVKYNV